jgi:hypothetical protein
MPMCTEAPRSVTKLPNKSVQFVHIYRINQLCSYGFVSYSVIILFCCRRQGRFLDRMSRWIDRHCWSNLS